MSFGMTLGLDDPFVGREFDGALAGDLPIDRAGLHILGRADCLSLLGAAGIGAFTVTRGALPVSLPVGYTVHDGSLVVRVSPVSILAQTKEEVVAFCAYAADISSRRGWSVSATGMARRVVDREHQMLLNDKVRSMWSPGGPDDVFISLAPVQLSGRLMPAI